MRSIHWTRNISITNDCRKSHGHYFKTTRMRRTRSRCSIRLNLCQNERCTEVIENSEVRMSRYLDTSTETQKANIIFQHGRPSHSSWTKSVRSSSGRSNMGKAMWESSIEIWLGKSSKLRMFFVNREKGLFLSVYVDDLKLAGKSRTLVRHGKFSWKTLIWEIIQHHSSTMFIMVALKVNVRLATILWMITEVCSNQGSLPGLETWCRNDIFMVLWHGRSCKEMRGQILRTCE